MEVRCGGHSAGMNEPMFERRHLIFLALACAFAASACLDRVGTREAWTSGSDDEPKSMSSAADEHHDAAQALGAMDASVFVARRQDAESAREPERAARVDASVSHDAHVAEDAAPEEHDWDEHEEEDEDGAFEQ